MIAPVASIIMGVVVLISLSEVICLGRPMLLGARAVMVMRREYIAVRMVAVKNMVMMIVFVGLNNAISMIKSFEKNPAMKGSPDRAIFADRRVAMVRGICCLRFPMVRRSWEWWCV